MTSGVFSLDATASWVTTLTARCQKWGDRHFKLRISGRARCSTFNIQRCHFQAQHVPSPNSNRVNTWSSRLCSQVLYSKLLRYMARTSGSKKGGVQKPKGGARQQGRKNGFSGIRLEFLDSYKDQFLDSTADRGGFYTKVAQEFILRFGYGPIVEDNSEPCGDDDDHSPENLDSLLPLDEKNLDTVQQNKFYLALRNVSNLLHKCGAELTASCIRSSVAGIGTDTHPKTPMRPM